MANTYQLISSVTVGSGGAASISFTSIPATYTDLVVLVSARSARTIEPRDELFIRFNSDSGNNYSNRILQGNASSSGSGGGSAQNYLKKGTIPAAGATANTFSNNLIYIPNYAGSTVKSVSRDEVTETNSATNNYLELQAGLWSGTSAITTITFTCEVSTFVEYSTAYLYGISNA